MTDKAVDNNEAEADRKYDRFIGTVCFVTGIPKLILGPLKAFNEHSERSQACEVQLQRGHECENLSFDTAITNPSAVVFSAGLLMVMAGHALRKRTKPQGVKLS